MKKLFPILLAVALLSAACQMGGGQAAPTPIPLQAATVTPIPLNPTAEPENGNVEASSERVSPADGMIEVFIPEGTFQMGGVDPAALPDEQPVHQVTLRAFWIDKVEVTNAMYNLCIQQGGCQKLPNNFNSETRNSYFSNPEFANYPVIYVGWGEAQTYCKWAGRRLPTEAEWERAARGSDFRIFPWGDDRATSTFVNHNYKFGDTTPVGNFPAGASPYGVLDMSGNVAEWVNDFYQGDYYSAGINNNPTGPLGRTNFFNRVVRGGSFADSEDYIRVSKRASTLGPDLNADLDSEAYIGVTANTIGFRCASDN